MIEFIGTALESVRWQDIVLSVSSLALSIASLPSLINKDSEIPRRTSGLQVLTTSILSTTYFTMSLAYSSFTAFLSTAIWSLIFVYRPIKQGEMND